jgi:hypothetical protein
MIMVLVVLIIVTVGIVQFGVFMANAEQVAMAARVGGLEASQTSPLPVMGGVPANIILAIEHQLESSCIDWCHIRVEHNVNPPGNVVAVELESDAVPMDPCECDPKETLDESPGLSTTGDLTRYVRVTVCVPLSQVMPKQLSFFGEQIYGPENTYEHTAIYRYEIGTP